MKKISAGIVFLLTVLLFSSGCANRATATLSPGTDLGKAKQFYVVKLPSDKHGVDQLITDQLVKMGYAAKSGPEMPAANYTADVVVTYQDKWMWDITMYMIELTVTLRNPGNGYPLATGNSLHTSLTRKSVEGMVEEVLANIFNESRQKH